ncbi:copper amine oxidase-like protein [Paenibacillus cellulosilyticus]|uniref:Copper amine oxidase-like protein n=1 Tax=Paenibacillus cellulosilyticus TaxID=375489 RepID=A0A2V2YRK9_9BACL|nr:cell wall hydrolase [Paenibacillus cellulosilyticus]PWV99776.1 copper amine oxidase-like protein [Paenibacillus cellulosilyticus]QKS44804.1 cell wall hydrolase [Paenibacillus cellulosilyticus]
MIRGIKIKHKITFIVALAMLILSIAGPQSLAFAAQSTATADTSIWLNGKEVQLGNPIRVQDDRMYVPAGRIATLLGASVSWDSDNEELTIETALNDTIVFGNGVPVVYFNDVRYRMDALPFTEDGRLYVPIRTLAEVLHAQLQYNTNSNVVAIASVQPAVITDTYTIEQAAKDNEISKASLLNRNGLSGKSTIKEGTKLRVVLPSFWDQPAASYTKADLILLAKITTIEAGYESYEGQLAVANVILNRVKSGRFPNTIHDVIYSGKQFPPAHDGTLDKVEPKASALRAAKDALNGKNNVEDAVYFFNPDVTSGSFWSSLDVVATIGHHSFAK